MNVSVVIPTFQRPELLARCLRALATQSVSAEDFEVVVADDAADPSTRDLVARLAGELPCSATYVPVEGTHGPAGARNIGWRTARGSLIAFTDDDTIPATDWLSRGLASFGDGRLDARIPPFVIDKTTFTVSALGQVYALDADTGAQKWTTSVPVPYGVLTDPQHVDAGFAGGEGWVLLSVDDTLHAWKLKP